MSGKPKKNKAPKDEMPVEDEIPLEAEEDLLIEETVTADAKKDKKGAPESKKKKKSGFKLSSIDPIILASFSVFLAACLIVTGVTVYGIVSGDNSDAKAEYGSKIVVDYTGSYFHYYDETGAVIFDTSYSSIGDSADYKKSYEWPKNKTYDSLTFTIGSGQMLAEFEEAFIGHKPGDTFRIPAIVNGYGELDETNRFVVEKTDAKVTKVTNNIIMTAANYKSFFSADDVPGAGISTVKSPYGWDAQVCTLTDGRVSVEYIPVAGTDYDVCDGLKAHVTSVGAEIVYSYEISSTFAENTNMLKAVVDGKIVYIIGYDGTSITYKTTNEKTGIDLYFTVTFVEYAKS